MGGTRRKYACSRHYQHDFCQKNAAFRNVGIPAGGEFSERAGRAFRQQRLQSSLAKLKSFAFVAVAEASPGGRGLG
jgi:hypothetical protein